VQAAKLVKVTDPEELVVAVCGEVLEHPLSGVMVIDTRAWKVSPVFCWLSQLQSS